MDRDEAIRRIRAIEPELRALGVTRLALFGSVARGEARPGSDVDVVVDIDRGRVPRGFGFVARADAIAGVLENSLGVRPDLITAPVRKPRLRDAIERDVAAVF